MTNTITKANFLGLLMAMLITNTAYAQDSLTVLPVLVMSSHPLDDSHVTVLEDGKPITLYYFVGGEFYGLSSQVKAKNTATSITQLADTVIRDMKYGRIHVIPKRSTAIDNSLKRPHEVEFQIFLDEPGRFVYIPSAKDEDKPLYERGYVVRNNAYWKKVNLNHYFVNSIRCYIRPAPNID